MADQRHPRALFRDLLQRTGKGVETAREHQHPVGLPAAIGAKVEIARIFGVGRGLPREAEDETVAGQEHEGFLQGRHDRCILPEGQIAHRHLDIEPPVPECAHARVRRPAPADCCIDAVDQRRKLQKIQRPIRKGRYKAAAQLPDADGDTDFGAVDCKPQVLIAAAAGAGRQALDPVFRRFPGAAQVPASSS